MITYPDLIPPRDSLLLQREISEGERKIFQAFKELKDYKDWFVCHSLMLPGDLYKSMYEMDFVLAGPPGLFIIEVKGTVTNFDPKKGIWDYGYKQTSTSPFKQASDARYSLLGRLKDNFKFDFDIENDITHGIGVIFIDNNFNLKTAEWDLAYVLDAHLIATDPDYLSNYIKRFTSYWQRKRNKPLLDKEKIEQFRYALQPQLELAKMLRYSVDLVDENLTALTKRQYKALDLLQYNDRIIFEGGAGTGKTFLAMEAARRFSMKEKKVLFVCFNPLLAAYLRYNVKFPELTVISIHEFFYDKLPDKKKFKRIPETDIFSTDLYTKELPQEFTDQVELTGDEKYDLLLIDEAQDLLSFNYLMAFDSVLKGGWRDGNWCIFLDSSNQINISGYFEEDALKELKKLRPVEFPLHENCRNTIDVMNQVKLLTGLNFSERSSHNFRGESQLIYYESQEDENQKINNLLKDLKKRFHSGDITLLTSKPFGSKVLHRNLVKDFNVEYLSRDSVMKFPFNKITVCNPINFKGLENRVMCIIDVDSEKSLDKFLLYVSLTRARYGIYLFVNKPLAKEINSRIVKNATLIAEGKYAR